MKIAILGWGSLLWDLRPEFDEQHDGWNYDGPELKIEFSRVSESRDGALALVIDENNGSPIKVAWCLSKRSNVDDALRDLRCREDTSSQNIGQVIVAHTTEDQGKSAKPILAWARDKKLDAVVWTALESNFDKKRNQRFTVVAAVSYLQALEAKGKAKAFEYVIRAPHFVKTPLRDAFKKSPWFKERSGDS